MVDFSNDIISPYDEMVAYETLWALQKQTLKKLSEMFKTAHTLPTEILAQQADLFDDVKALRTEVVKTLSNKKGFSVCCNGDYHYPDRLRAAKYPIELFYYKGQIGILNNRCISVVGARSASEEGQRRAARIVKELIAHDFTIVSGLARGIDTAALQAAIQFGGKVVGVIGTPIDQYYPKENQPLQDKISDNYLLISQVPFHRYSVQSFQAKRVYFPERNETMSALSEATVIIEASERSGTLTQARAALNQGRKLFILNSCFENKSITWPERFEKKGAIRVHSVDDIISNVVKGIDNE